MNLLVDSHAFLWSDSEPGKVGVRAREAIASTANRRYFSLASVWELAVKAGTGKLELDDDLESFVRDELRRWRMELLPIELRHAARVRNLPHHHKDPFDRLLVAQAQAESMVIVTNDRMIARYDVQVVW
ncbi:MAG: type II toxin-antitoxin system VapC family toxin [Chloroflexi bacterium]|nr:type II toxin-antitoxin system VapC family toxin [Chloroflexota bacterium]